MTSKEERKRLLIEMMKEDEKNGMYEVPNFVEPILLKAGDKCVKINGQHPYVDCRIISEDNYQLLLSTIQKLNKFKIQAYELQSASQFKPSGVKTGWISVEERLPEVEDGASEDVLCLGFKISPSREETATYEVMHWMKFDQPIEFKANGEPIEWGWSNKWWNNNVDYYHVFYWMPLPQSPE